LGEGLSRTRIRIDCFQITQSILNVFAIGFQDGKALILPDEEKEKVLLQFHQSGFAGGGMDNVGGLFDFICVVVVAAVARPVGLVAGSGGKEEGV